MNEVTEQNSQPTLQQLAAELERLRERVEDLEGARELDAAIRRNAGQPLLRWGDVKGDLGL